MATATTPKRSLKRTVASTVEDRSPRFLLGSLALAMVISLVAGLGIGMAIGDNDDSPAKPTAGGKPTPVTRKPGPRSTLAPPPAFGVVVRTGPQLLVVSRRQKRTSMTLARGTRIDVVRPATRSEIKRGSRVLFVVGALLGSPSTTSGDASSTTKTPTTRTGATGAAYLAKSVLIVSGKAANRIGSTVTAVTSETMTFRAQNGKPLTVSTVGAKIEKTVAGSRAKLIRGRHVLVKSKLAPVAKTTKKTKKTAAKTVPRRRVAIEIIALPNGSAFG
jgi:hypothetical protein